MYIHRSMQYDKMNSNTEEFILSRYLSFNTWLYKQISEISPHLICIYTFSTFNIIRSGFKIWDISGIPIYRYVYYDASQILLFLNFHCNIDLNTIAKGKIIQFSGRNALLLFQKTTSALILGCRDIESLLKCPILSVCLYLSWVRWCPIKTKSC